MRHSDDVEYGLESTPPARFGRPGAPGDRTGLEGMFRKS